MTMQWLKDLEQDDEFRKVSEQERLKLEVTEAIAGLLEASGTSRAELARRMGTSAAFVTKLLRGDNNFTLQTMSDIFFVLGRSAHVKLAPLGDRTRVR